MNVNREMLAFLRKQYPVGTRIRLDSMQDPYAPVEAGTTGKLDYIDDAGQFHMKWDNGRTLALIPGVDSFTVLPPELSMTKLYMPLTAELYEPDVYGNMQEEPELLTGHDLTAYEDHIRSALVKYRMPEEVNRGIMHWYDAADSVNDKVRSVTFDVERRNGKLWGIAECQISGELSVAELTTLKKYIEGQASDGWGEGFEQYEIAVGRGSELYEKIGRSMREGEGGVLTPHGYVMQESELRQAPSNLGRPPRKPPYMIYFLCVSDVRAAKLYLPAKQAELDAVLDCLEVDSWQEVRLEECDAAMPEMWRFTDMAYDSMEQINRFAQCLEELDRNNELIKFKAVAGQLDIRSLDDALALAEHLSEYALEPGLHSLEELAREELSVIVSDPDRDLLTRHLNMEAYGADLLWRDQGLFSDYGYICRPDGQPLPVPRQGVDMTMQ